jgi:hypothetical protein
MKKQKFFAVIFCCALLIGFSSITASAQGFAGTVYRLTIYPAAYPAMNADASFLENGVFIIDNLMIGGGSGSYYDFAPAFFSTYRAVSVTLGDTTGDLSMYLLGTLLAFPSPTVAQVSPMTIIGLGVAIFTVTDENIPFTTFWFVGTQLL